MKFEKNEYFFSEFLPESEKFNLDSSQRFLNELLFPKKGDAYAEKRMANLKAVGNHKLAQLFHPLIFIVFSFCFLIGKIQNKTNDNCVLQLCLIKNPVILSTV